MKDAGNSVWSRGLKSVRRAGPERNARPFRGAQRGRGVALQLPGSSPAPVAASALVFGKRGGNYPRMIILFCLNYLRWKEAVRRGGDVRKCDLPRASGANPWRRKITSSPSSPSSPTSKP